MPAGRGTVSLHLCPSGSSSLGRARPCQGRGSGFEARLPLQLLPESLPIRRVSVRRTLMRFATCHQYGTALIPEPSPAAMARVLAPKGRARTWQRLEAALECRDGRVEEAPLWMLARRLLWQTARTRPAR